MQLCDNIVDLRIAGTDSGIYLPFKLDGSERYRSAPQVLSFAEYLTDHSEWAHIWPFRPHWSGNKGSWPVSSSANPVIAWAVDMFYQVRWRLNILRDFVLFEVIGLIGPPEIWRLEKCQRWYEQSHIPEERRSMDNIQLWLEAMDFSQVHTLTIAEYLKTPKGQGLYEELPVALTGLRTLKIEGRWIGWRVETPAREASCEKYWYEDEDVGEELWSEIPSPAQNFLTAVHPKLESLTWTKSGPFRDDIFEPVLKHHGPTLKHLEWTNRESRCEPRPILSVRQIRTLGEYSPRLTNLTIDLNRVDGVWPWKHLKAIAENLPKLTSLIIYLDMQGVATSFESISEGGPLTKPLLNKEAALEMFNVLNLFKTGDKLRSVEFRGGDWGEVFGWVKWNGAEWLERSERLWANCSLEEKRGTVKPICEIGHSDRVVLER
ncbi:hypothetical protein ACLX1H_004979 [Fusarium chlamydosporum]